MIHRLLGFWCCLVGHDDITVIEGVIVDRVTLSSVGGTITRKRTVCARCRRLA